MCVVETELKSNYYKDCLFNNNVILKLEQRFKSGLYNVYTEKVNKIVLSSNDDKMYGLLTKLRHILRDAKGNM